MAECENIHYHTLAKLGHILTQKVNYCEISSIFLCYINEFKQS